MWDNESDWDWDDFYDESDESDEGFNTLGPIEPNAPKRKNISYASEISSEFVKDYLDDNIFYSLDKSELIMRNDDDKKIGFFKGPLDGSFIYCSPEGLKKTGMFVIPCVHVENAGKVHSYNITRLDMKTYIAHYNGIINGP